MSESEFDMITHFGAVDELVQLIYQGANKFVLVSAVESVYWTLHLGLTGPEGRWWKGKWAERDIFKFLGNSSAPHKLIETFSERLADNIEKGELFIGNWSSERGAEITLTLNPSARSPVHIPLEELDPVVAASYASKILSEIASQAQKTRNCRLYPLAAPATLPPPLSHQTTQQALPSSSRDEVVGKHAAKKAVRYESTVSGLEADANAKIKDLEAELARANQEVKDMKRKADASNPDSLLASRAKTIAPAVKPVKGASLANPNKKARRFAAMEFED
ncbi:hypothetical protein BDW22DRAFT_1354620 [Trametopsis cervina]|nr:hypothetical protein BDW22DRAFT_1354620 [Trametopsis cervina]